MQSLLKITSAQVLTKGKQVFESLDFDWQEGEQWAIIGSSGAELTTFIETIRGNAVLPKGKLVRPFAKEYTEMKTLAGEINSFRDLIAYVSQRYEIRNKSNQQNFYFQQRFNASENEDTLTVREYLSQVEAKVSGPWTLEKVAHLLRLEYLLDKSVLLLSNGETRRLALGLGLMRQPRIYLMDQPMTGLDVKSRAEFGEILKVIISKGVQVLLTTSANEIPEGITHVAKLSGKGIEKSWEVADFHLTAKHEQKLSYDWELLDSLLPKRPNANEEVIRLENLSIKYGEKQILNNLNWEVRSGERWLLKGANGSGKSTLISLLIGENPQAYSQNLWLFGRKRGTGESIWDVKRPTGFVAPELSRFFPANQTCRKVILSGLFDTMGLFKKVSAEQENLAWKWMTLFHLEAVENIPINRLSLENQRWTLLTRALIKEPKLLILDEASQGMDEFQRRLFKDTVQQICERSSMTLVYVSHYAEDVPEAVGKVIELR
ncbi:ATP-binding cassette domain-containing protein [Algoriphagus halophytocola]|uniref:ATP-binding cassette domain-containing protein n=1 Tax=Algoriphagus halophytocola TaxID=2991499 RepID=A0ABY6MGJ6_9BACT|nr:MULTISPECIES: ATP-binding cassette domain-containing protein [unclassified Algoriphagus]UZD22094.1 ATP-binding cassette domain-containing protein [Algoriphagus sp. TR-M5]WBL43345.1 ATP-binding cassette domain-containing protein [Algoriphagus sp. TR-M9]